MLVREILSLLSTVVKLQPFKSPIKVSIIMKFSCFIQVSFLPVWRFLGLVLYASNATYGCESRDSDIWTYIGTTNIWFIDILLIFYFEGT